MSGPGTGGGDGGVSPRGMPWGMGGMVSYGVCSLELPETLHRATDLFTVQVLYAESHI